MIHMDWKAWDAWMEANDHLVQKGIVPTCEEITRKVEFAEDCMDYATCERNRNIAENHKFDKNVAILENARTSYEESKI